MEFELGEDDGSELSEAESLILFQTNPWLQNLADTIGEAFLVVSSGWDHLYYSSPAFEAIWGFELTKLHSPSTLINCVCESDRPLLWVFMRRCEVAPLDEPETHEFRINHNDGSIRWVRLKASEMHSSSKGHRRLAILMEDLTEQRKSEAERRLNQFVLQAVKEPTLTLDPMGLILSANEAALKQVGLSSLDAGQLHISDVFPDLSRKSWRETWNHWKKKKSLSLDLKMATAEEKKRDAEVCVSHFHYEDKEYLCVSWHDVTERNILRNELQKTQLTIDSANEGVLWFDLGGNVLYANDAACELIKVERESLLQQTHEDLLSSGELKKWEAALQQSLSDTSALFESKIRIAQNDTVVDVEVHLQRHEFEGQNFCCCFLRDITDRKEAENLLKLTQFTMEQAPDAVFWVSTDGQFLYANDTACKRLGYEREALLEMYIQEIDPIFSLSKDVEQALCDSYSFDGTLDIRSIHQRKDGSQFPVEITTSRYEFGEYAINCAFARDITERILQEDRQRQDEEKLAHMNRLSSMGEMGAAMAHELNQPLTAICNYSYVLSSMVDPATSDPELANTLGAIKDQAIRAGNVVRRMKGYVRDSRPKRSKQDMELLINDTCHMLEPQTRRNGVTLIVNVRPDLPVIELDSVQIQQVLVNLVRNACDALEGVEGRDKTIKIDCNIADEGNSLSIVVTDNGPGFSKQCAARLFEPFNTTKSDGMGMGLAICRSIAIAHGGDLVGKSTGAGAVFEFAIPVLEPSIGQSPRIGARHFRMKCKV